MSFRGKKQDSLPRYNDGGSDRPTNSPVWPLARNPGLPRLPITKDLNVLGSLIISWIILVNFFERTHVKYTMLKCKWRHWERWDHIKGTIPHRIALLADPQLVDENTYPDRPDIVNYFIKKLSDNYLHKTYRVMQHYLDPDTVLFLGDLFDGGREWDDELWFKEYRRFNQIFAKQANRRTIQSLAGNHDIGFETIDKSRLKRFAAFFGPPNDFIELGNHTVVLVDSISLSSEDPEIKQVPQQFLESVNGLINENYPRILLTHVPLYRYNDKQLCGPLRESNGLFPIQKGTQYQTVILTDLSSQMLETVKPLIVFSGDDHDYCDVNHKLKDGSLVREITVKSTSMTAGIKYPAIQLLSLNNPTDIQANGPTLQTEMCFLPSPYLGLTIYILWLVICILVLAINFLMPQLFDNILVYFKTFSREVSLPFFTSTSKTQTSNRDRDVRGFFVSLGVLLVCVYIILGLYYHNV